MGSNFAHDLTELDIDVVQQLTIHLRSNCYPPVPLSMVNPCLEAIHAYHNYQYDLEIDLPNGVLYRNKTTCPANKIIENFHLDAWLGDN